MSQRALNHPFVPRRRMGAAARLRHMKRQVTWAEVLLLPVAFAGGAAGLACALLLLFEDREALAAVYALAGVTLACWTGVRALTSPPSR